MIFVYAKGNYISDISPNIQQIAYIIIQTNESYHSLLLAEVWVRISKEDTNSKPILSASDITLMSDADMSLKLRGLMNCPNSYANVEPLRVISTIRLCAYDLKCVFCLPVPIQLFNSHQSCPAANDHCPVIPVAGLNTGQSFGHLSCPSLTGLWMTVIDLQQSRHWPRLTIISRQCLYLRKMVVFVEVEKEEQLLGCWLRSYHCILTLDNRYKRATL